MASPFQQPEIWKPIPGFLMHQASSHGRIRRVDPEEGGTRLLKLHTLKTGYLRAYPCEEGRVRPSAVHRLVLLAFAGEPPSPDHQCAHWDGTRDNNRPDNLRWATPKENGEDKVRHGRSMRGAKHWTRYMRWRVATGDNNGSRRHPDRLPKGEHHWSSVQPDKIVRGERQGRSKLTEDEVRDIRAKYQPRKYGLERLASEYGVSFGLISHIVNRRTWRHI